MQVNFTFLTLQRGPFGEPIPIRLGQEAVAAQDLGVGHLGKSAGGLHARPRGWRPSSSPEGQGLRGSAGTGQTGAQRRVALRRACWGPARAPTFPLGNRLRPLGERM